ERGGGASEEEQRQAAAGDDAARPRGQHGARGPEGRPRRRSRGARLRGRAVTPFSWQNPYAWPRKPLLAANAVATSQPLAAQAGLQMLAEGGTAIDAVLATAITLSLVEPVSNGIGPDAYGIVGDGAKLHGLKASGRSPA